MTVLPLKPSGSSQAGPASSSGPLLKLRGVNKAFAGVQALSAVDLDLYAGEVHAVLGENGAGKSTLMKILFGVIKPDSGDIVIEDLGKVVIGGPRHALSLGIGLVSQELSLVPQLEVAQNVFLGQKTLTSLVEREKLRAQARTILNPIAPHISVSAPISSLNMAERQVVEIARTLARGGRVIAFDEPTSSLTPTERDGLFTIIAELKKSGKAVVYISHRMQEIGVIADRVTVLRDGRVVATGPIGGFTPTQLSELIVGRKLNEELGVHTERTAVGEVALSMEKCSTRSIAAVSLTMRRGEIFGLTGLLGSGRTEVVRAIFGVDPLTDGAMSLDGRSYAPRSAVDAIRRGVALIPEDRRREALIPLMDAQRNFGLGNERFFSRLGFVRSHYRRNKMGTFFDSLQIRPRRPSGVQIRNFSGGNQQKVIIARWLQSGAKIFLFDEPTRGIDVGAKAEIHEVIRRMAAQGAAVLIISSEIPEILTLAHRIGVMRSGTLIDIVPNSPDLTEEKLMGLSSGDPVQWRAAS
jgi:ABC-type sugar transport system ATPase subunit